MKGLRSAAVGMARVSAEELAVVGGRAKSEEEVGRDGRAVSGICFFFSSRITIRG